MRIADELDLLYPLTQLIECGARACQQRFAIGGHDDALRTSIEESRAQHMLQASNDGGHGRGRNAELDARLRHAAAVDDREENEQISQLHAAADLFFPVDR